MALLLVSAACIASRFVNDEELPDLLKRREKEGMTILPIIVRDCLWQTEPVLKDLHALPTDGLPSCAGAASRAHQPLVGKGG